MQVYIETYGCASNFNDSEIIAGLLSKAGFEIVNSYAHSDVIVLNTCTVKEATVNKMISRIKLFRDKKLVISGCMPHTDYELIKKIAPNASLVSTRNITKIPYAVSCTMRGKKVELISTKKDIKVCLPKVRRFGIIDTVEICSGCNYACSYCSVKFAKGSLLSYPIEKIIKEIKSIRKECKEIWITGQDIASYNYENITLPELINEILNRVKGKYYIRLGMMNPSSVKGILNDLIHVYRDEHIFKFLHIPVQSGSDKILRLMNRTYKVMDFINIVNMFRNCFKHITIWTDVILGFPNETHADFSATISLIKRVKPDYVNISRFTSRRNTKASRMKQIKTEVKKERSRIMSEIVDNIATEKNRQWIGWEGSVLIDEPNIGRNFAYKPVLINGKIGEEVKVRIIDAKKTCLISEKC